MKIGIVLGTRPEIIKLSPIIRALQERNVQFCLIHSGQHYSPNMDAVFFEELKLPAPAHQLTLGLLDYRRRIGTGIRDLMAVYMQEELSVVVVEGDTTTVLVAALAAARVGIPVAHVEAGLRSHDLAMPEEVNRILTDHLSTYHYPPTQNSANYLTEEGVVGSIPFGNTIVDAVKQNLEISRRQTNILETLGLTPSSYLLVTAHRQENVDDEQRLAGILEGLRRVAKEHADKTVYFPLHPRTAKMIAEFGLRIPQSVRTGEPIGYLPFLQLLAGAYLVLTDSGGIQEEATVLRVPCVTLRDNTERPETVTHGMNMLAGTDPERITQAVQEMCTRRIAWKPVYGEGSTGKDIVDHLIAELT